jgi:hypothetical protein
MKIRNMALAALVAASGFASAGAQAAVIGSYTVEATTPFGSWLDTGISLNSTTTYDFAVLNPATVWSAGSNQPSSRDSDANGITTYYGTYTAAGFTANFGALVGDVGGFLFLIGTGPTSLSGHSGELTVGYWDSYYGDNSGSQKLQVSSVPETSTWVMMLAGFAALGFVGYRKAKSASVAA